MDSEDIGEYACKIPREFNKVIGGGGFGDIFASSRSDKYVLKGIKKVSKCRDAKDEFDIQEEVYKKSRMIRTTGINVPEPVSFCNMKGGSKYSCFFVMERLKTLEGYDVQVQLTFNDETVTEEMVDRVVGRDSDLPVSQSNPPRGFYMSLKKATSDYNIWWILKRMGILMSVVTIHCGYNGADVEYILNPKMVSIIDYGLCEKLPDGALAAAEEIFEVKDRDLYFPPVSTHPYHALYVLKWFVKGSQMIATSQYQKRILRNYYVIHMNKFKKDLMMDLIKNHIGDKLYQENYMAFLVNDEGILRNAFRYLRFENTNNNFLNQLLSNDLDQSTVEFEILRYKDINGVFKRFTMIVTEKFFNFVKSYSKKELTNYLVN